MYARKSRPLIVSNTVLHVCTPRSNGIFFALIKNYEVVVPVDMDVKGKEIEITDMGKLGRLEVLNVGFGYFSMNRPALIENYKLPCLWMSLYIKITELN